MKKIFFFFILSPLIYVNYWLRARGLAKDRWFYPDIIAFKWGYSIALIKTNRVFMDYSNVVFLK